MSDKKGEIEYYREKIEEYADEIFNDEPPRSTPMRNRNLVPRATNIISDIHLLQKIFSRHYGIRK
ncbi:hypothetical protein [Rossellomorea aquimaris]|uniref:hypothetical protein n=1 Tax=Rossellomorea aquimaris TaxID=189382 RepID=UPI0005CAA47C|nr:hypothetical protein [Rossellomorea aquimaris]